LAADRLVKVGPLVLGVVPSVYETDSATITVYAEERKILAEQPS
jgi:hypothetical protein